MNDNPLVSVCVITYNSSKYIVETLDSILNQSYKNIELIISDDCSKDNTVEICKEWLRNNNSRFVHTHLITSVKNTGTAANVNRGIYAASGQWIKGIAGDDVLLPECIAINVRYVNEHPDAKLVFSQIQPFGNSQYINSHFYRIFLKGYGCLQLKDRELFYLICLGNFIPAATSFINKSLFVSLDGHDESIPLLEDWPFWIKASWHMVHFHFIPIRTVRYRMHDSSISIGTHSEAYMRSVVLANQYALYVQKQTNILLWFFGICDQMRSSSNLFVSYFALLGKVVNPISYYIKYLQAKANRLSKPYYNDSDC